MSSETKRTLRILHLYPRDMNIYGDNGNVLALMRRAEWHGLQPEILTYNPGDRFPTDVDMVIGGGGQDSGQNVIQANLQRISPLVHQLAEDDVPMLMICGLYQLFGRFFKSQSGEIIDGIGIFDMETHAGPERLIGNIMTHSEEFGDLIGYENHSGQTFLGPRLVPLGTIIHGAGNNGQDTTEGARYHNVIGTYLHGSLLPKNPRLADALIDSAVTRKYGDFAPTVIDDRLADKARLIAMKRPR